MRWYKTAGLTVSVGDYRPPQIARNISDIGYMIQSKLYTMLEQLPPDQLEAWKKSKPYELFTIDGLDVDNEQGIMNFYCNNIPQPLLGKMIAAIKYYAKEISATVDGPVAQETFRETAEKRKQEGRQGSEWAGVQDLNQIRVMRFNAKIVPSEAEFAPEVDLATMNAMFIFREVLNYPSEMLDAGGFRLDARELLMKIGMARNNFQMQARIDEENDQRAQREVQEPGKARIIEQKFDVAG